jgi:hypothetical protein
MRNLFTPWCGIGLLVLLTLGTAVRADPPVQTRSRGLQIFLSNLTPAARGLAQNSLRKFSPAGLQQVEREYDALGQYNDVLGMGDLRALAAEGCNDVLRYVPARDQQRYMNGFFGVSFQDKRFADEINQQYAEMVQRNLEWSQLLLREQMRQLRQWSK